MHVSAYATGGCASVVSLVCCWPICRVNNAEYLLQAKLEDVWIDHNRSVTGVSDHQPVVARFSLTERPKNVVQQHQKKRADSESTPVSTEL